MNTTDAAGGVMKTLLDYFVSPSDTIETVTIENFVTGDVLVEAASPPRPARAAATGQAAQRGIRFSHAVASAASNDPGEDRACALVCPDTQAGRGQGVSVFAVYDGHGGNLACDIALATLAESLRSKVRALGRGDVSDACLAAAAEDAYRECDALILGEARQLAGDSSLEAAAAAAAASAPGRCIVPTRGARNEPLSYRRLGNATAPAVSGPTQPQARRCWNGREYFDVTGKKPERAGSCAVTAVFRGADLSLAHVGDCRAFRLSRIAAVPSTPIAASASNCSLDTLLSSGSGREHLRRSPRAKKQTAVINSLRISECTEDYGVTDAGYAARSLTVDHCCEQEAERVRVRALSADPAPFRPSRGDLEALGSRGAPMRVAGSLSVTRALGDGYLKTRELSAHPYEKYLPYITCTPSVHRLALNEADIGLILASDGFWNNVSISETILVVEEEILQHTEDSASATVSANLSGYKRKRTHSCLDINDLNGSLGMDTLSAPELAAVSTEQRIADSLLKKCVANAAISYNMSEKNLRKMPPGQKRRDIIDDVTVMVILFEHGSCPLSSTP
jgi:serine/threonine protein phosphatase PrpC